MTGDEPMRREPYGSLVRHADMTGLSHYGWNEIVVDGRGNVDVNSVVFRFGEEGFRLRIIAMVSPGGSVRQVADGIAFPNGMVVTPDNTTLIVAESFAGRLTAFDSAPDGSLTNRCLWADVGGSGGGGLQGRWQADQRRSGKVARSNVAGSAQDPRTASQVRR